MHYLDGLKLVHERMQPESYIEIGARFGDSLALANCRSIAIDPINRIRVDIPSEYTFYEMTSDDFFSSVDLKETFPAGFDLGFIDGMHLAEFSLRDFINLEKLAHPESVILMDDVLPAKIEFAGRTPEANAWCGDVYKAVRLLKRLRPDLRIRVFDIPIKGFCVIDQLNPDNTDLSDQLEQLERDIEDDVYTVADISELREEFAVEPREALAELTFAGFPPG